MSLYRSYAPEDDAPAMDGDVGFVGVDMRRDPGQLEPGLCSEAWNIRFTNGVAQPRRGIRLLSWGSQYDESADPGDIMPYDDVSGGAVFNDPITGNSWVIIVTSGGIYKTRPGVTASSVSVPSGESLPDRVQLVQTYNGLILLRGNDLDPLYCNNLDTGFAQMPEAANAPGNRTIPPSSSGIYFQNRLFVIDGRAESTYVDTVFVSDFGTVFDVLEGSAVLNSFRINQGSSDRLVALYRFNDTTLIAAKDSSIYVVSNIYGTNAELATNARLDAVTTEYGCKAGRSFVQVGSDVWFLAHRRGICSIRQTEQNKLQGVDVPVSRDIEPLIQRINWEHAANSVAAFHDNKVYFAVPLDSATYNNAVLVYDTLNQRWAGVDQGTQIRVKEWVKYAVGGAVRLLFLSDDGFLCLYEDGFLDQAGSDTGAVTTESVEARLLTRGYGGKTPGIKRFGQIKLRLSTWWARFTGTTNVDGIRETHTLADIGALSRTRYRRPHDAADWDPSNANDDFHTPHREDYAIIVPESGMITGTNGLSPDLHQTISKGWRVRQRGQWVQLEIETTQGRVEVRDVAVELFRASGRDGARS